MDHVERYANLSLTERREALIRRARGLHFLAERLHATMMHEDPSSELFKRMAEKVDAAWNILRSEGEVPMARKLLAASIVEALEFDERSTAVAADMPGYYRMQEAATEAEVRPDDRAAAQRVLFYGPRMRSYHRMRLDGLRPSKAPRWLIAKYYFEDACPEFAGALREENALDALRRTLDAWSSSRSGRPKAGEAKTPKWEALAELCQAMGLVGATPETLARECRGSVGKQAPKKADK